MAGRGQVSWLPGWSAAPSRGLCVAPSGRRLGASGFLDPVTVAGPRRSSHRTSLDHRPYYAAQSIRRRSTAHVRPSHRREAADRWMRQHQSRSGLSIQLDHGDEMGRDPPAVAGTVVAWWRWSRARRHRLRGERGSTAARSASKSLPGNRLKLALGAGQPAEAGASSAGSSPGRSPAAESTSAASARCRAPSTPTPPTAPRPRRRPDRAQRRQRRRRPDRQRPRRRLPARDPALRRRLLADLRQRGG